MKAFLMEQDHDFDIQQELPSNAHALMQDLELPTLFNAMALGDEFLYDVAKKAVLSSVKNDVNTILYRQHILQDCLKNASIIREIYAIAVESIENERKNYWGMFSKYPATILHRSIEVLQMFVVMLKKLRQIADEQADQFESEGFQRFFSMLIQELSDEYFGIVQHHLKTLKFHDGMLISAELGPGHKGINYTLRKPHQLNQGWIKRIFAQKPPEYSFSIHPRDESGARALSELKDRGINLVANALARSAEHILSFFKMLRTELAFYIGCLNLYEQLAPMGESLCFPQPVAAKERKHAVQGLYDVCLALTMQQKIVGNTVNADNTNLVIITGANQGGKSTFLRSIGLAQLMMQCGMFTPAKSFCANLCDSLFTHYKREEDASMKSGKLDEELSRMSTIVNHLTPNALMLFNESFAATNEREGSEIGRQIVSALLEKHLKVFFVTHLYEFAHGFYIRNMKNALFLRAERYTDGTRTFQLVKGEPLSTSYGADLYQKIFRTAASPQTVS
ncbi:DNA mismatch repair protein MutS domain protein [Candidatus Vecturithrix granuli]|uniref:DNA mismatch repair protein MutS domain protein n=1 Tax=Vecturithrix granuli TaxID=1499967 RepID=A0A081C6M1_VECG1|nr:DNA mismatch repair protein MutS domain protein [Candidatus Vecturithrix granuli]